MINLEWFRTFKAIYETGSLTAAANHLFISQPGVSLHLNSLEAHTGNKLFDRGTRKMTPTEHGQILYNSIVEGLNMLENAEKHFYRNSHTSKTSVSVGMCFETFQLVLEPFIIDLPFDLISKFGDYPQMLSDLDKGLLDLIVTPYKEDSLHLKYTAFSSEKIILITGSETDTRPFEELLEAKDTSRIEKYLTEQTWFGTAGDMEHLRIFWIQNFKKRPSFKPNFIVPNMSSIIRCISNRKGWAIVPDILCKKQLESKDIKRVWEGIVPLEHTLYFAQRKKSIYTKEIKILQDIITKGINNTK
ncbi:MAG: hypothetical protein RL662_208 [Bacteroidota bacterium]|jgi:DNA-binding transcriptional LysR family regulator